MNGIIVYTGPMFCGKSNALLSAYERATIAEQKVLAFKPKIDKRFGNNVIKSRKFGEIEAINISNLDELLNYDADVYVIDEFQFLEGNVRVIQDLANNGKLFRIAGLDMTAEGKPFGLMSDLLAISSQVIKFVAVCMDCKKENAIYSYYLGKKNSDILIGNHEYIPLCRSCWIKRNGG